MKKAVKNYLLIHGAWHGSWAFDKIVPRLSEKAGAKVYSCDLPGHFRNDKYDFKNITMDSYVDYVLNFIRKNIDGKVILVGHSMGGAVISAVGEKLPQPISRLVYISAFIPSGGGSLLDEEKKAKFPSVALKVKVDEANSLIALDKKDCVGLFYNNCSTEDIEFALSNLQNQPLLPFVSPIALGKNFADISKTYVECLRDKAIHIEDQRRMNGICDKIVSIDTDHSPFFSARGELIDILGNI